MRRVETEVRSANWMAHVNSVNPGAMRSWLVDRTSLTFKLIAHSRNFRLQRLAQQRASCLVDEYAMVELARRSVVSEREVLLYCDGVPVVFAHTVVPLGASASDWPFFSSLGERSLGTTLFGDPLVRRGDLQFTRLPTQHPLLKRARKATAGSLPVCPLFARRCLFRRKQGLLLVTEVFLPGIAQLQAQPRKGI